MKKRWKRKGGKVIAAIADWQAPPRYRKLDDVREALALWAYDSDGNVERRVVERSGVEDEKKC